MTVDTAAKRLPVGRGRGRFWQDYNIETRERILLLAEASAHDTLKAVALHGVRDLAAADGQAQAALWLVARPRQHRNETVADADGISEDKTELGRIR